MARLSPVLHQALAGGSGVAAALDALDGFAAERPATRAATVFAAVLDPDTGAVEYAGRAHPPPLVVDADGATRFLDLPPAGPLGVGQGPTRTATTTLSAGETLLAYTDGLVERPGAALAAGMDALAQVAASAATTRGRSLSRETADRLCELTTERLGRMGYADDVTLLAAHRLAAPLPALRFEAPASVDEAGRVRQRMLDWLRALGAGPRAALGLALGVYEAAVNAAEHAYAGGDGGPMSIAAVLEPAGTVRIEVADRGVWREQPARAVLGRGRGLSIMRAAADRLDVRRTEDGTTVTFTGRVEHPAVLHEPGAAPAVPALGDFGVRTEEGDPAIVRVIGPVDAASAPLLRQAVAGHGDAGGRPVVVDLGAVTFLASAGVQALHELAATGDVRLAATRGPVLDVLALVGLGGLVGGDAASVSAGSAARDAR